MLNQTSLKVKLALPDHVTVVILGIVEPCCCGLCGLPQVDEEADYKYQIVIDSTYTGARLLKEIEETFHLKKNYSILYCEGNQVALSDPLLPIVTSYSIDRPVEFSVEKRDGCCILI